MLIRFLLTFCLAWGAAAWSAAAEGEPVVMLKKLLIADTDEKVLALSNDAGGTASVFVQDVAVLSDEGFRKEMDKIVGKQITPNLLSGLEVLIQQYSRAHDRLIVKVNAPVQNAANGVVRLSVAVGRYQNFVFRGNRWFSSKLLQQKLGIKADDEVRLSTLEDAVKWANANPFRQITVVINDLANQPGKADLVVGVNERIPFRFTVSGDNYGNDLLGNNRYVAGIQFGNLWGRDHQGSYQFMTTNDTKVFKSHSFDYKIPLAWRHYLQLSGGYLTVSPSFGVGGVITQKGENLSTNLRYVIPRAYGPNINSDFAVGIDFKQGNNTVAYNNVPQITATNDTFQLTLGYTMVRRDRLGAWVFGGSVNASPGNINKRNTNAAFTVGKPVTATYLTGTLSVQRLQNFTRDWSLFSKFQAQAASGSLPGGEQMSIGGAYTVRGFDERIYSGDQGFVLTNDLQSPPIRKQLPFLKKGPPLETRFIAFYDAAQVFYKFEVVGNDVRLAPIASTGLGLRMNLGSNFSLTADYGWHTTHFSRLPVPSPLDYHSPDNGRGHLKVVLAY